MKDEKQSGGRVYVFCVVCVCARAHVWIVFVFVFLLSMICGMVGEAA